MRQTALILGANGKIGQRSSEAFSSAGWEVRHYDRQAGNMTEAAQGADVIVNGLNPPAYHDWKNLIPQITAQVIAAARASGATVIIPGNVYNLDDRGGQWSEATPHSPPTKKGRIREDMERAYRESGVRTIVLRAGNFIDPDRDDDIMGIVLLREIAKWKITSPGDPEAMQAYCYVPDWARAAVALANRRDSLEPFEDVPFEGHAFTATQLQEHAARVLGRPIAMTRFPWWVMSLLSPFWELAREMNEMRYLFNLSHWLSGEKLRRLVPDFVPTPREQVMSVGLPIRHAASSFSQAKLTPGDLREGRRSF